MESPKHRMQVPKCQNQGYSRAQQVNYPRVALREMILNSLVHRSYLGPMVQMRIYDDHIVLWNYGTLPTELSVQQLFAPHPSFPRNPLIANACFRANMIEAWGSGIHRILAACNEEGFPTPIIEETMGGVQITLWNNPQNTPQKGNAEDSLSEKILALLTANNRLSQQSIASQLGIGFDTVKEYMTKLKRTGKIQRIGPDRGGYWKITDTNEHSIDKN